MKRSTPALRPAEAAPVPRTLTRAERINQLLKGKGADRWALTVLLIGGTIAGALAPQAPTTPTGPTAEARAEAARLNKLRQNMSRAAAFRYESCSFDGATVRTDPDGKKVLEGQGSLTQNPEVTQLLASQPNGQFALGAPVAQANLLHPIVTADGTEDVDITPLTAQLQQTGDGGNGPMTFQITLPEDMSPEDRIALKLSTLATTPVTGMGVIGSRFCYSMEPSGAGQTWTADPYDPVYFHVSPAQSPTEPAIDPVAGILVD